MDRPKITTLLFDFDGTIADTLPACIDLVNKNAISFGYRQVKLDEIERLKGMTPFELLGEFKVPIYKVPFLLKKVQLELFEGMDKIKVFPGMKKVISTLQKKDYLLGIITSNTEQNVQRCLDANGVTAFDFIHNERNILGKSQTIKNVIKRHNLVPSEVVYIGDEVRDIEASRKSKVESVSVTWGFNTAALLAKHSPDYLVKDPIDLLTLFH